MIQGESGTEFPSVFIGVHLWFKRFAENYLIHKIGCVMAMFRRTSSFVGVEVKCSEITRRAIDWPSNECSRL
jgi:hypothetical protein